VRRRATPSSPAYRHSGYLGYRSRYAAFAPTRGAQCSAIEMGCAPLHNAKRAKRKPPRVLDTLLWGINKQTSLGALVPRSTSCADAQRSNNKTRFALRTSAATATSRICARFAAPVRRPRCGVSGHLLPTYHICAFYSLHGGHVRAALPKNARHGDRPLRIQRTHARQAATARRRRVAPMPSLLTLFLRACHATRGRHAEQCWGGYGREQRGIPHISAALLALHIGPYQRLRHS